MRHDKFACFILTHGRPDRQKTYRTLRRQGYTGLIYLLVDDEDSTLPDYQKQYGKEVIVFSKKEAARFTDKGDIIPKLNTVLFARNMCHTIAAELGLRYFLELDDDYSDIQYRYPENGKLGVLSLKNLSAVFDAYLDFLDATPSLAVCFMQGGDFIGGVDSFLDKPIMRKAMNAFFCRTDRPFKFVGRMNDDVNTYITLGHTGNLFFSFNLISIVQTDTQQQDGGLTEMYKENGTYMKSFYTVMMCPSAVNVSTIRDYCSKSNESRYHHVVQWNNCTPKILPESCRKVIHG